MAFRAAVPNYVRAAADYAAARTLFSPRDQVLVALSGGPDSCALLLALCEGADAGLPELLRPVLAAHFHHGLRGADADQDAAFSAFLAAQHQVPCVIGLGSVQADGLSPNDAARRDRYAFLIAVAQEAEANVIAVAHTADDQAETVLGRVLRGTSVDGLAGIAPVRELAPGIRVVRPLLGLRRADGEAFLAERGVTARQDPSNRKERYTRSRLRARLPGLAADFNPRLTESLTRLSHLAAEDAALLAQLADAVWERCARRVWPGLSVRLDVGTIVAEPAALRRRVLLRALHLAYAEEGQALALEEAATLAFVETLDGLLGAGEGAQDLPGGVRAVVSGSALSLDRLVAEESILYRVMLEVPGQVQIPEAWLRIEAALAPSEQEKSPRRPLTVSLNARSCYGTMATGSESRDDASVAQLVVRPAQAGERIAPLGMEGRTRLIRDVMAGAGWSASLRATAPVVFRIEPDGTEVALWIIGLAQAEETRVAEGETGPVVRLSAYWDC